MCSSRWARTCMCLWLYVLCVCVCHVVVMCKHGISFETTLAKDLTDGICQFIRRFDPD